MTFSHDDLQTLIIDAFEAELKCKCWPDGNFFLLGGDSLSSENVLATLSGQLEIDLPGWLLLDYPTPKSIAGAIRALGEPVHG